MSLPGGKLSNWGKARKRRYMNPEGAIVPAQRRRVSLIRRRVSYGPSLPRFPLHYADQPMRVYAKMKYTKSFGIPALGAGAIHEVRFNANGAYDPEVAVGGHQPYGFDQTMVKYQHYTVVRCSAEARVTQATHQINEEYMLVVHTNANDVATVFASGGAQALNEMQFTSKKLQPNNFMGNTRSTYITADIVKLAGKRSAAELIGDSRHQGDAGANPTEDFYITFVAYHPLDSGDVDAAGIATVTLTYFIVFTEPRFMVSS